MLSGVDAVVAAAGRGLALFPLPAGGRRPDPGWHQACTTDPDAVRRLWAAGNVGVGCRACNVVGLDLDRRPGLDGIAAFDRACAAAGKPWPDTLTVATPSGGRHLYFRAGGRPIASTSDCRSPLGPGIDTRGPGHRYGGYLVGPGSRVSAGAYVLARDVPIAALPAWLATLLTVGRGGHREHRRMVPRDDRS